MRTPTALAALLCAGLATGPALASSTTIIDFTIEVTEIIISDPVEVQPLFVGKTVGDTFDGVIALSNPLVDIGDLSASAVFFAVESIVMDSFDPIFFSDPRILLGGGDFSLEGSELIGEPTFFFIAGTIAEPFASDFDLNNPTAEFLAASLLLPTYASRFFVVRTTGGLSTIDRLEFDVISASIRPDATVIPLPAAGWLMVAGLGGLTALRHSKTIS